MDTKYNYAVVIPHFTSDGNVELLKRAVASIPERSDIQVLVVDNSIIPIPNTLFQNRGNVEILYSPNERKAGGARNVGLEHAEAKWVLFVDADDFFTDHAFCCFDEFRESSYDMIYFKSESRFSDDLSKMSDRADSNNALIETYFATGNSDELKCNYPEPWGKLISAHLINSNQLSFDEVPATNDKYFSLNVAFHSQNFVCDSRVVYCVTLTEGSITRTKTRENNESSFFVRIRSNKLKRQYGYGKYADSVMSNIINNKQYGLFACLKLFTIACLSGDIMVGYKRWFRTWKMRREHCRD